jgi:hypothetical protein
MSLIFGKKTKRKGKEKTKEKIIHGGRKFSWLRS